jgi:hypothetical protein
MSLTASHRAVLHGQSGIPLSQTVMENGKILYQTPDPSATAAPEVGPAASTAPQV